MPSFWLPTIDSLVRALNEESWVTDHDVGDMFLNYQLHCTTVPYTGVDLSSLYENEDEVGPHWAVWDRNLMGFAASPYNNSIKMALVAEEVCRGDRHEAGTGTDGRELNPFQWASIQLNLPGSEGYACKSRVSKMRADGRIACDLFTFVDDEWVTGPDEDLTWQASHALASKQSYLGIQGAARKAQPSSKTPGA